MSKEKLEPAYVLHTRPFQETSLIVDVLTRHYGRISLIAKGAKRSKSIKAALLQPFSPIMIAWVGKSELHTLTTIEAQGQGQRLQGNALMCGLYLNELLVKILDRHDAYPHIYDLYATVLGQLSEVEKIEQHLRQFELGLLKHLGYELSANDLTPEAYYMFSSESGFIKAIPSSRGLSASGRRPAACPRDPHHTMDPTDKLRDDGRELFKGSDLFAILHGDSLSVYNLPIAKRLMRVVIQSLLQGKSLNSRMLFISEVKSCQMSN